MLDLDGFKQVNDRYRAPGRQPRAARQSRAGLKSVCREYDYVARMGGDEFVVLLPGVRPIDVDTKIMQFRDVVKQMCQELFLRNSSPSASESRTS